MNNCLFTINLTELLLLFPISILTETIGDPTYFRPPQLEDILRSFSMAEISKLADLPLAIKE